ncbi:uncharacterized protein LOC109855203 [Pseudomyrmex gracilis]|uniref:uncharacterized protein LOC109855203 n=1 Tax=Pseudomyrmex gracilis TaxID=219809 RepID=UPI000994D077|nr:uncharacterized protein LOC109855203 [Pseudomyrmex gracilis]XP_020284723.1 uncharacterized protein LOC109855203 [Pseudomyrmex gracilis]
MSRPEDKYYLFLMEVFVRRVSSDRLAKLNQMFAVPTVVHFGFFDFVDEDDLTVTSADPLNQSRNDIRNFFEVFNAGKSVLFPLDYNEVANCAVEMVLNFTVKKQMSDNIIPKYILVGTGTLNLSKQYLALRKEILKCWGAGVTTTKELDAEVPLIYNHNQSGTLDVFVKLSSYGETIVTEFDEPITEDFSTSLFGTGETTDRIIMHDYRKTDSSVIDLCEASSKNLQELFNYPANMLKSYICAPCGKEKIVKRDEGMKSKVDDRMLDVKLKDALSKSSQSSRSQFCKPVVLKVSGLFDNGDNGCKKPTVTVAAEPDTTKPDATSSQHDIFVLRIGKKGLVGVNEKSDIQLEMKTPKGSERRPPIRYETRDIQTDLEVKEKKPLDRRRDDKKKHKAKKKQRIRSELKVRRRFDR